MNKGECLEKINEIKVIVNFEVNDEMKKILREDNLLFNVLKSVPYVLSGEGKRKRSIIIYLCYLLKKEEITSDLRYLSAFVELIQTASLIHDDIIDGSSLRRGKMTVNKKYGIDTSIITGDYLIFKAFNLLSNLSTRHYKKVNNILSNAFEKMCYGQELEKVFIGNVNIDESKYNEMIYMKTAIFMESICECSFVLAEADYASIEAIKEFGKYYGMAYQLEDDIKFFESYEYDKSLQDDIDRRLVTLPISYSLIHAEIEDVEYLREVYSSNGKLDYDRIKNIVIESGAIEYIKIKQELYLEKAISKLKSIESGEMLNVILEFLKVSKVGEVEECLI